MLYNNALRDYNGGKNDLADQEFNDYIKYYPEHRSGRKFVFLSGRNPISRPAIIKKAVTSYDLVLQNFPSGTRPPRLN